MLAGLWATFAPDFLGQPLASTGGSHAFVPEHVFNAANYRYILGRVTPAVCSISFGFQLWKTVFPLPKHIGRHLCKLAHFRNAAVPARRRIHNALSWSFISSCGDLLWRIVWCFLGLSGGLGPFSVYYAMVCGPDLPKLLASIYAYAWHSCMAAPVYDKGLQVCCKGKSISLLPDRCTQARLKPIMSSSVWF